MVGAVVQRENASFARMRSGVQFPSAPPYKGQFKRNYRIGATSIALKVT